VVGGPAVCGGTGGQGGLINGPTIACPWRS
jgi:hypothetical protein